MKENYFELIQTIGNSKEKELTNQVYFYSSKANKAIFMVGNKLVIEDINKISELKKNEVEYSSLINQKFQKYIEHEDVFSNVIKQYPNYYVNQFLYEKSKKRVILSIKLDPDLNKNFPLLMYYDLKIKKCFKIQLENLKSDFFENVHFIENSNGRFLIAITHHSPQNIFLYDLLKMKVIGTGNFNKSDRITDIEVHTEDHMKIYAFSMHYKKIKIIKLNDNNINEEITLNLNLNEGVKNFLWFDKNIAFIADSKGFNIIVIEILNKHKINIIQRMNEIIYEAERKVLSFKNQDILFVKKFSKGVFLYLSNNIFLVLIFNKFLESDLKENKTNILVPYCCFEFKDMEERCVSIDFSKNEEKIIFGFEKSSFLNLSMILILKKTEKDQIIRKFGNIQLFNIHTNNSFKKLNNIDFCGIAKHNGYALMASLRDNSIILYNYITKTIELVYSTKKFVDFGEINYIIMHPSGLFITCGFQTNLVRFSIIYNNLVFEMQNVLINDCYLMKHTKNGDYIICCYNKNKIHYNSIGIIDSTSLKLMKVLSNNMSRINDLAFTSFNSFLWCCTQDGVLHRWSLNDFERFEIFKNNDLKFLKIEKIKKKVAEVKKERLVMLCEDIQKNQFLCFQNENSIHNFNKVQIFQCFDNSEKNSNARITYIKYINLENIFKGIVLGNSLGYLTFHEDLSNYESYTNLILTASSKNIKKIKFIERLRLLLVFGSDGIFNVYNLANHLIKIFEGEKKKNENTSKEENISDKMIYNNHTVIPRSYLDLQEAREKHYLQEIQDLVNKMEIKIAEDNRIYQENLKNVVDKYEKELLHKNNELQDLITDKQSIEKQTALIIQKMEDEHLKAVEELERIFEKKLTNENEKMLSLQKHYYKEKIINKKELNELNENNKQNFEELKNDVNKELTTIISNYNVKENEKTILQEKNTIEIQNLQNEHDLIVAQMKVNYESKIEVYKNSIVTGKNEIKKLKISNNQLLKDMDKVFRDMELEKNKMELLNSEIQRLEELNKKKNEDVNNYGKKIKENELVIYELNGKIENLDKTKQFLQYQTDEIAKGLEPKDDLINKLKSQVLKLKNELNQSLKKIQDKDIAILRQKDESKALNYNIRKNEDFIQAKDHFIKNVSSIIRNCVFNLDPKYWYIEMKKLYDFIDQKQNNNDLKFEDQNEQRLGEVMNQVTFLQNRILQNNKEKNKFHFYKKKHIKAKTEENTILINELNHLRKERKNLITQKNALEMENRLLKNQTNFDKKRFEKPKYNSVQKSPKNYFIEKENQNKNKFLISKQSAQNEENKIKNVELLIRDLISNKANRKNMIKALDAQMKSEIIEKLLFIRYNNF